MPSPVDEVGKPADPHFPVVHVRPAFGWVNDPNGPIWHKGRFHLYFQHNPARPPRGTDIVWGHASSPDLVNWEVHRIALSPSPEHPGVEGFWSGNTVEHDGRLFAFYSALRESYPYQLPHMTASDDGGYSFAGDWLTAPAPEEAEGAQIFRDPFVWQHAGRWRMIMGSGRRDGTEAQVRLYESDDMRSWTNQGIFAALSSRPGDSDDPGSACECPQYAWGLGALFVCAFRPGDTLMRVLAVTGTEIDGKLQIEDVRRADYGTEFYAPSLMRAPDGTYLLWGWLPEARAQEWVDEAGWAGVISLPREVSLDAGTVKMRPARQLTALRRGAPKQHRGTAREMVFEDVPRAFEFSLQVDGPPTTITLNLELGEGQVLVTELDQRAGQAVIDRQAASSDGRATGGRTSFEIDNTSASRGHEQGPLRWFVDQSVSELFLPEGLVATTRFYPVPGSPWRLRVTLAEARDVDSRLWALSPSVHLAQEDDGAAERA